MSHSKPFAAYESKAIFAQPSIPIISRFFLIAQSDQLKRASSKITCSCVGDIQKNLASHFTNDIHLKRPSAL